MTKMIDYEDNVFFITERTKLLEKGVALALDPALFSQRFRQDAEFISRSLIQIREKIDVSTHTLKRPENLRALMLANQRFTHLIPSLMEQGYLDPPEGETFQELHNGQVTELGGNLENSLEDEGDVELISSQEFEFLLKENGETE